MNLRERLADLAQRNLIATQQFGPQGEKLKSAVDDKLTAFMRLSEKGLDPTAPGAKGLLDFFIWDDYRVGRLENIQNISLRWLSGEAAENRLFEFIPDPAAPLSFVTSDGRKITPGRFLTDGGTIPDFATAISGIDRFTYLPAYLVHDWEYSLHHCKRLAPEITREHADRALLEALKTMMTTGLVRESRNDFWAIQTALETFSGRYWDADTPCSL